jgi:hypothetical protein
MSDRTGDMTAYQRGRRDAYEQGLHEILARLDRLENIVVVELMATLRALQLEKEMKQSTQDLIDAVTGLTGTVNDVGTAIDALVAAQDSGDDAAVEEQVGILKGLGPQLKAHLPTVATAGTAVAQAPEDTGATVPAPAAS